MNNRGLLGDPKNIELLRLLQKNPRASISDLARRVAFPALLERLGGTPARAEELVAGVLEETLAVRPNGKWAAKDHLGHPKDLVVSFRGSHGRLSAAYET